MTLACLLAAALVFSRQDAEATFALTGDFLRECTPRDAGTPGGRRAAYWLFGKASIAGGDVRLDRFIADTPEGKRSFVNLYRAFERDPGAPWTVLVSHFDTKPGTGCPGANDGAATSCLLVRLAGVLCNNRDFKRNVLLIWTDAEECRGPHYDDNDGFQGSKRAAAKLKEKNLRVEAVYVLDMLADSHLDISIPANGSGKLARRVLKAAERTALPENTLRKIPGKVLDDHVAFLDAGFDALDLIDFNYGSKPGLNDYWHTAADDMRHISEESLFSVGRLVCELLSDPAD